MIFLWLAVALGVGAVVAFIAREKGRPAIGWALYGAALPFVALPHVLIARTRDDRSWSPVRFGIPEREVPCPHCGALVRGEAIACRHCHKPLYEAIGSIDGSDDHGAGLPKKKPVDETERKWLDETFSKFADDEGLPTEDPDALRADPYARVTDPDPDEERLDVPREPAAAERVRRGESVSMESESAARAAEEADAEARFARAMEANRLKEEALAAAAEEADRIKRDALAAAAQEAERQKDHALRAVAAEAERLKHEALRIETLRAEAQDASKRKDEALRAAAEEAARLKEEALAAAAAEAARLKEEALAAATAEAARLKHEALAAAAAEAAAREAERQQAERAAREHEAREREAATRAQAERQRAEAREREAKEREARERAALAREAQEREALARDATARAAEARVEPQLSTERTSSAGLTVDPAERLGGANNGSSRPAAKVEPTAARVSVLDAPRARGHGDERTRAPLSADGRPPPVTQPKRNVRKIAALAAAAAIVGFVVPWAAQYLPIDKAGDNRETTVKTPGLVPPPRDTDIAANPSTDTPPGEAAKPAAPTDDAEEIGTARLAKPVPTRPRNEAAPKPLPVQPFQAPKIAADKGRTAPAPSTPQRKAADAKPSATAKPDETKAAAAKPAETKPDESEIVETKPAGSAPTTTTATSEPAPAARSEPKSTGTAASKPAPKPAPKARVASARTDSEDFMAMVGRALGASGAPADRSVSDDPQVGGASGPLVQSVQQRLRDRGFDPGSIDGMTGPKTVQAIRAFQQSVGMRPDGRIDMALMERLGIVGQQLHVFGR